MTARASIAAHLNTILDEVAAITALLEAPPVDPPPPPPPATKKVTVPATALRLVNAKSMVLIDDHIAVWGQPGEAVEFDITADRPAKAKVSLVYVLASESQDEPSSRDINDSGDATLPTTTDVWANPVKGTSQPVEIDVATSGTITVTNTTAAEWSNWCDLYAIVLESDADIAVGDQNTDTPPPPPPPPPQHGPLDLVLKSLFPSDGPVQTVQWGQNLSGVAPGTTLVVDDFDKIVGEWNILGLKGTPDNWITLQARNLWGAKARGLQVWHGIGLYGCEYVRVDGFDLYGMGGLNPDGSGDFVSGIEAAGGHHVACTRIRATDTGGHCVSMSWNQGMGLNGAPANAYLLYNVAYDTSKRNPFNGSAFNIFHATSKRTPDGPLARLGYTDYVIGNQAFGCRSEVGGGQWGITDGNCFILDVGRDAGYDGNCLVAFNVGADNGGRGVHTLQTDGLVALFNTMVGNQTNVTEPASGEFSPHTDNGQRCVTAGNIAAATSRQPAVWYQDWQSGRGGHVVKENVVLAGSADPPNNVPLTLGGLSYLRGGTTKSRDVDDYRPKSGTPLTDTDLIARFHAIADIFPGPDGAWRDEAICGALDT